MDMREQVRMLVGEWLRTKNGKTCRVVEVTDSKVYYEGNGQVRKSGNLDTYDRILAYIKGGGRINGPADIQKLVPGDWNTSYEWAVLQRLNLVS